MKGLAQTRSGSCEKSPPWSVFVLENRTYISSPTHLMFRRVIKDVVLQLHIRYHVKSIYSYKKGFWFCVKLAYMPYIKDEEKIRTTLDSLPWLVAIISASRRRPVSSFRRKQWKRLSYPFESIMGYAPSIARTWSDLRIVNRRDRILKAIWRAFDKADRKNNRLEGPRKGSIFSQTPYCPKMRMYM